HRRDGRPDPRGERERSPQQGRSARRGRHLRLGVEIGAQPLGLAGVNLVTAFIASRVIGLFDGAIEKLVALAALMPIVAGIGGNSGNQTITMIVRAMALDQLGSGNTAWLLRKELGVGLVNGLLWGGVIGAVAWWLYDSWSLGVVMTAAMTLNLLLAALMG